MNWILHTTAGLLTRIAAGCAIFLVLALVDLRRNGRSATRWREYLFLLACVLVALLYGIVNDQITTTISWEYFAYGKGVAEKLPAAEPNSPAFRREVAKIGLMATWSVGLLIGVALLLANNPSKQMQPLSYWRLFAMLGVILIITLSVAAIGAMLGWTGFFAHVSQDFEEMLRLDQWRPRHFMTVYGIHLGGYVGGILGTVIAVVLVRVMRRRGAVGPSPRVRGEGDSD
jgi:hypothetical protein